MLKSNEDPFAGLEKPANHFGDISEHKGELYTGIEWFEDGRGKDIQIAVYDATTLKFKRSFPWKPESGQVEVSALAVDVVNGLVWGGSLSQDPCAKCRSNRPSLEGVCPNCGWNPVDMREEREPLIQIHRLRRSFRDAVQAEIAQTVTDPDEIAEEVRYLGMALS